MLRASDPGPGIESGGRDRDGRKTDFPENGNLRPKKEKIYVGILLAKADRMFIFVTVSLY